MSVQGQQKREWRQLNVASGLNLRATVESGQPLTFYANYRLNDGNECIDYVTQRGEINIQRGRMRPNHIQYSYIGDYTWVSARDEITSRFGLSHDMKYIYSKINTDPFMNMAISSFYGMRVTENQPWEATLCFLVSQFNNMKRIRSTITNMIKRFGNEINADGYTFNAFPTPNDISKASIAELMACGTGFRAKYIKNTAGVLAENIDYLNMQDLNYKDMKHKLIDLDGVGDKVADCILLFGYKKHMAFPIDVWVKRVMENIYFNGKEKKITDIHDFAEEKWGSYSGYAQQYLFECGRRNKIGVKK